MMRDDATASAALTLLESLMITLEDRGLLTPADRDDIFDVAIAAHRGAIEAAPTHEAAARLLERAQARANGLRRG